MTFSNAAEGEPLLRWIVQYNNKIDVCGGLYPVNMDELVKNHFTWVFEPYRRAAHARQNAGRRKPGEGHHTQVCERLRDLLEGSAGIAPITAEPEILYTSPYDFVIADEKGDPQFTPGSGRAGSHEPDQPGLPAPQRALHLQPDPGITVRRGCFPDPATHRGVSGGRRPAGRRIWGDRRWLRAPTANSEAAFTGPGCGTSPNRSSGKRISGPILSLSRPGRAPEDPSFPCAQNGPRLGGPAVIFRWRIMG